MASRGTWFRWIALIVFAGIGACVAIAPPWIHVDTWEDVGLAEVQAHNLAACVQMYAHARGELPPSLDALTTADPRTGEPYIERIPLDPWTEPYVLRPGEDGAFTIVCGGPDRIPGTSDDIVWPPARDP